MALPHVLKRIRLHLARSKEFPSGSASHGYEFVAPLDSKGHEHDCMTATAIALPSAEFSYATLCLARRGESAAPPV
jgi:hypothetical protein